MGELLAESTSSRRDAVPPSGRCRISIVVPVGPGDNTWRSLVPCLAHLADSVEVSLVATAPASDDLPALLQRHGVQAKVRWIVAPAGRAVQMNEGARHSVGEFLWFLHADSQFSRSAFVKLLSALEAEPAAVHYFDLQFERRSIDWLLLNEWGVRFRSRLLGLPFGDQGLCLPRQLFNALGAFDETVAYGEDHLLVWSCHRAGIWVRPIGATLTTSPRKYRDHGWLRTTMLHAWRTWRQALPQLWQLILSRRR